MQLDDELGRFGSTKTRPEDPGDDAQRQGDDDRPRDRLEPRVARIGCDHRTEPHKAYRDRDGGRSQKRCLRPTRRPAQRQEPPQDQEQDDEREGEAGDLLRPIDCMGDALAGRDGQQVARVRVDQCPHDLPGERHHDRPDNRPPDEPTGPPFRDGEYQRGQERDPELLQQQPERPQCVRARPFEVRAQQGQGSRGEQQPRPPPPRPFQREESRCRQSPRKPRVSGDPRAGHVRMNTERPDGKARCDDKGRNEHRVAQDVSRRPSRSFGGGRRHSRSAAKVAAESFDLEMKPRAPQDTTRRP